MRRVPEEEKKDRFIKIRISDADKGKIREAMDLVGYKGHEQDFVLYLVERGIAEVAWEQEVISKARKARAHAGPAMPIYEDTRNLTDEDLAMLGRPPHGQKRRA